MTSNVNKWLRKKFNELKLNFPHVCDECDHCPYDKIEMEFAHLKPTKVSGMGRGRIERYYDIKNNMDSYILTCHEHNLEMDT